MGRSLRRDLTAGIRPVERILRFATVLALSFPILAPVAGPAAAQQASDTVAPEIAGKSTQRKAVTANRFMVVTAH